MGVRSQTESECPAMCICNMLFSLLCHAELLKSDWLERLKGEGLASEDAVNAAFTLYESSAGHQ